MTAKSRWRWSKVGRKTLQFRLTLGVIVLLALASIAIALVTTLGLRTFLLDQVDAQLAISVERYDEYLRGPSDDDDRSTERSDDRSTDSTAQARRELGEVPGLTAGLLAARVADSKPPAQAYVIATGQVDLNAGDAAVLASLPAGGQPRTVTLHGGGAVEGPYRVVATSIGSGEKLVVGVPLEPLERTMARLLAVEAVVFVVVIVVAGAAGGVFVGRALQPLRRVAGTATRVVNVPLGSGAVELPQRVTGVEPESEVGHVADALNLLLDHVEASFAQRQATEERLRRFVADASHELRTPVAVIRGYAELAQRQADQLPERVVQALDRIGSEAGRMSELVDELLLLARLDSGRPLARERVDLTRLVLDVVDGARVAGPGHRWFLELPEDPIEVVGDRQRLHQVLANLTANARVHTPPGTSVTVGLQPSDTEPGWVDIHVTDDGPGIPPSLQPELFERFVRGTASRSRTAGSTGLGLAIVAAVAAAHGGRVDVESEPGRTRFTLHLPAAAD